MSRIKVSNKWIQIDSSPTPALYSDYSRMLERKDIDAVIGKSRLLWDEPTNRFTHSPADNHLLAPEYRASWKLTSAWNRNFFQ